MSATATQRRQWIEELATNVGRLRRRTDLDVAAWMLDPIANLVERLWIDLTPTAADMLAEGLTVDEALEWAEREKRRQHRILADELVEKRRLKELEERRIAEQAEAA